ncbi:MAG: choice-of-anchor D domain-containing protein [Archangiaceae bacterium]|nr:choice-of-anchor D domain-containing protein [Archangiaceae bacterium]
MAVLFLAGLGTSACDCHGNGGVGQGLGDLGIVWKDADGVRVDRDATFDFGSAFVGERIALQMVVRNSGRGALRLVDLTQTDGALTSIGDPVKEGSYFEVKFTPVVTVEATGETVVDLAFTPRVGLSHPVAKLKLTAENTRTEDDTAVITLKGQGEGGACELPSVLDFGEVPLGEHFKLGHTFKNTAMISTTIHVGDVTGPDAASFVANFSGDATVPAQGERVSEFTFSPTELRSYQARVTMKGPGDCPEGEVQLIGKGADQVLTWEPDHLDFGYVSPMVSAPREVTFTNHSNVPIVLTGVGTDYMDFSYLPGMGETPTTFTVAGGGTSKLTVACRPSGLGARSGTLFFDTPLTKSPHGVVNLSCVGGGPSIKVTPRPTLPFGKVGFFPGSSTYSVSRKVTVQNVGTRPPNNDPKANLFLGQVTNGVPGGFPLLVINPTNSNTLNTELEVGLPASYDPMTGLTAQIGQNLADLVVTLRPASQGPKEAELIIYSNDPVEPVIKVTVSADAQPLPPCNLQVAPTSLNFGLVTPPDHKDLGVTIKNLGVNANETCSLSGIELAAGSDPAFSLVGGPIDSKELQPGQVLTAVVRVWPTGTVPSMTQTLTGQLRFNVADPTQPSRTIPLSASIGPVCLTIAPDSYDFGNVKKDCNTAPREFTIYNTCSSTIYVQGITVQAGAGQPAGGPQCPGGSPCPEFSLTSTPTLPTGGLALAPGGLTTFRARYKPIDYGADSGAIAIAAVQSGSNVTYLVSLAGLGDMSGQQTDTFQQSLSPKADVLLVVDDSCSMADKQMSLGSNFSAFLTYAQATGTDWQIGVTTTDAAPQSCVLGICTGGTINGKLIGTPKILTPSTPNVASVFSTRVQVGTNGLDETGFEAAVKALTPPVIANENAGFLRYDANLAVVVVSDAGDQGGQPFSYYLNRLRNVKGYQRANMFTFNVIGPFMASPPMGCTYDDYTDSSTYHQMASQTSGVEYEICAPNWATKLQDLGKTAFGYRTTFFLSAQPDFTGGRTLDVKIDGATVPAGDFTYDAPTQAVVFQPMKTPGPGKTLTVSYFKACL